MSGTVRDSYVHHLGCLLGQNDIKLLSLHVSRPEAPTLNLGLRVQRHGTLRLRRRLVRGLLRRVKERQQHGRQLLAHFLGVEVGVRPLLCVVAERELGERSGAADGWVVGAEGRVYDESAVEDQEGIVDAPEGIVVDSFIGEVDEHLRGQNDTI